MFRKNLDFLQIKEEFFRIRNAANKSPEELFFFREPRLI